MKTVHLTDFKENCGAILEQLDDEGIFITKDGKPVARLVPCDPKWADLIGSLKDQITINGDILSTGVIWDAES